MAIGKSWSNVNSFGESQFIEIDKCKVQQFTLHTLCRISILRKTEVMHSWKVDWNKMQKTRWEKLGIWDNWNRNLERGQNEKHYCSIILREDLCVELGSRTYCSGLSRGFASSLSWLDFMCFLMESISSFWALCQGKF